MKAMRILVANAPHSLDAICKTASYTRADLWRRHETLANVRRSASSIRTEIVEKRLYDRVMLDGTIRAQTTKDIVNDILTYKATANLKMPQAIAKRTSDANDRKRFYALLRKDEWLCAPFLHRQMRKRLRRGKPSVANQFVVRSDKFSTELIDGMLVVTLKIAKKYGESIALITTSSGKDVELAGSDVRILVTDGHTEIRYAVEKEEGRTCGDQVLGVNKGYTEAFTDSDGEHHGASFDKVITEYSDKVAATGKQRNKLHALEEKHREAGRVDKAEWSPSRISPPPLHRSISAGASVVCASF